MNSISRARFIGALSGPFQAISITSMWRIAYDIQARGSGHVFWSILEHMGHEEHGGTWHGRSSTGYAKEEGRSHLEDQLDRLLDQPVEFLNSTGQASTRSS
ncbi:unnamed protein product [Microthlaspi erraticum]|uniref:Uncharacterized protein n=1 Tax=Microthlaspi erraticum TaxID=1685480 RepID=A0A6D2K4Q0_9BRAS|nr:unnamed protein product [Microthlaspi erraticum]